LESRFILVRIESHLQLRTCNAMQVPFQATSMSELRAKVATGRYPPLDAAHYSSHLKDMCAKMLVVDVENRASVADLLQLPEVKQRLSSLPGTQEAEQVAPVLGTIVVPKNLKQLPDHLPAASYDDIAARR
jgi:hypothetical protein